MKKYLIWTSEQDLDDWREGFLEEEPDLTEDEMYLLMHELNNCCLDDARTNLSSLVYPEEIVVIGDIGRWNGRRNGYKLIKSGKVSDCLYGDGSSDESWYVDGRGNFRCTETHHDGTNYLLYRAFKPGVSEEKKEFFLEKVCSGKLTANILSRYTKSIGKDIGKVYGFPGAVFKEA